MWLGFPPDLPPPEEEWPLRKGWLDSLSGSVLGPWLGLETVDARDL